ncbi:MAG: right-handed parallel beta-helix repeat-containing protein, partial [Actinomycetota bacterium]|nr:right-handed parallel beta-helix repeat-containing protein [Actinomycetota bacterium]
MNVRQVKGKVGNYAPLVARVMLAFVIFGLIGALARLIIAEMEISDSHEFKSEQDPIVTWPTEPPARICGNQSILGGGPIKPPEGAVVVPAGDNSSMEFTLREENKTFWFEAGVHTLGDNEFSQIIPGSGSTYVGAPDAVINGKGLNRYAFTGEAKNVTIRYLTVRNFVAPMNEGVVNHNDGAGWIVEYSTIAENKGAGLMVGGPNNTYRYNCVRDNGQYGINACCGTEEQPVNNLVLDHNEITGNNTADWESVIDGCG